MVIIISSNGKRHYILPVCTWHMPQSFTDFAVSYTLETLVLGQSVE